MAMNSFMRENEANLTRFFNESLLIRKGLVLVSDGLTKWSSDKNGHAQLGAQYAPILGQCNQTITGIHAHAFVFDSVVVKTNLFGRYHQEGQRQWLEWCVKHQDNPLVPKVEFLLTDELSDRYLVVMERLECHSGFQHHEHRQVIDETFVASFRNQPATAYPELSKVLADIKVNSRLAVTELKADIDLMKEINDVAVEQELRVNLNEHEIALRYIDEIEMFWQSLTTVNSLNYDQIRSFWDTLTPKGHMIDLHGFNWMIRINGEQVLLDPVN